MKEIFDNYIPTSLGGMEQATPKFLQFEKNYKKFLPTNTQAKVLDIGIGRGEMLSMMKKWGYADYCGIDISPSTVGFCQKIGLNAMQVEDSTEYLAHHPDQYDAITMLDVLEHFKKEDIIPFLKTARAALKKGGVLIIQVPNLQAPDGYLHRYNDITHEVGFIEHSLEQVLMASGFEHFELHGFEQFVFGTPIEYARRLVRALHWLWVRGLRGANGNINPRILHPIFFAAVYK